MLNDEIIDKLTERVVSRYENVNTFILKKIGESIKKIGTLTPTNALKLQQVLKYGGDYEKIAQELSKVSGLSMQDIYDIFEGVSKKDLQFAKQFYDYRGVSFIPYEQNIALQRQAESIAKISIGDFLVNTSMLGYGLQDNKGNIVYQGIRETYNKLIDEAVMSISTGKETFQESMTRQLKTLGSGGLRVIYPATYIDKNGVVKHHTRRLDSVLRTDLQEGLRTLHNANQELLGEDFGYNGIEVSHHSNSAPDHIDTVDGKQFALIDKIQEQIDKRIETEIEQEDIRGNQVRVKGKIYNDFNAVNDSLERKVSTLNCKHYEFSIIIGVSKPEYTQEQLDEDKKKNIDGFIFEGKHYTNYEGTQLQRRIETEIRKQKDIQILAKASGNNELILESQNKITQLTRKYHEVSKASGLPTKLERAKVSGYRKTKNIKPKNYEEIKYARKNNQIWHSTENLEKILKDDKMKAPSIAVAKEMTPKGSYGTQYIEFKPEILENVDKNTILYRGDGGNENSQNKEKFSTLIQVLKNKPKIYNELKFDRDLKSIKYIKKVYIRQDEPKSVIKLLQENNIEYEIYKDLRLRPPKRGK